MAFSYTRGLAQNAGLLGGLAAFALVLGFFEGDPERPQIARMAALAGLMAIWWMTEAVPLAVTSLLPVALFPVLDIADADTVANSYINSIIFLFLGGFLIALAMERWNLHRRIALTIIHLIGSRPDRLVLGFMVGAALLSMWISNTATAVMMLPIALAVIGKLEEAFGAGRTHRLSVSLMLGIAYACSIGGVATLIGTPTNLAFVRIYATTFPDAPPIPFGQWLLLGLPLGFILLGAVWFLLTRVLCRADPALTLERDLIGDELRALGPVRYEEKVVLTVFAATALLWIFRADLVLGEFTLPGWSRLAAPLQNVEDGTVAIAMAVLLFLIPAGQPGEPRRLLDADVFRDVPWGVILLFGGGFALAAGFGASGLSSYLAGLFTGLDEIPFFATLTVVCLSVNFLTELTSNTATIQMLLPVLASLAVANDIPPLLLMIPATLSASMAFMLPVATPPNAIVFGSRRVRIGEMVRIGFCLNLIALAVILAAAMLLVPPLFIR